MSSVLVTQNLLTNIANAIRTSNDSSNTYTLSEMPPAILDIAEHPKLSYITIRPDAELIKTISSDQYVVEDLGITLPEYQTTSVITIVDTENISPAVTLDFNNYSYYIVAKYLSNNIIDSSSPPSAKGRNEYCVSSYLYEIPEIPAGNFVAKTTGKVYSSVNRGVVGVGFNRQLYWSSSSALNFYTASSYGIIISSQAPAISGSNLTFKTPKLSMRGNSTYLSSDGYAEITDIRLQYVFELYRAPKNNLNYDGWGIKQSIMHILNCNNSETGKLT